MALLACLITAGLGSSQAAAYVIRAHHHIYGLLPAPGSSAARRAGVAAADPVIYVGGPVMTQNRIYLIFWGPAGSFPSTFETPIIDWVKGLAADSGKTTNEFSVASLYYQHFRHRPSVSISRTLTFGAYINDTRRYPANACANPAHRGGKCLSDAELEAEIRRDIMAHHWPTDPGLRPRDQYLIFTDKGVDSCQDRTETACTFASKNAYCAYHSAFDINGRAVVYSNMPYLSECDVLGQAPAGTDGNPDTNGELNGAIHEILESATDPASNGNNAWITRRGYEVGDNCDSQFQSWPDGVFGAPLGGSLATGDAFNQVIGSGTYYTQQIWARGTIFHPTARCVQRIGPTPVFALVTGTPTAGSPVHFSGAASYDFLSKITRYAWNFGDSTPVDTTQGARAAHTYAAPGTYQVSLTVSDASGSVDASTQTQTVVVH